MGRGQEIKNTVQMKEPLVSVIIIDYKKDNPYLVECLESIRNQSYKNFETILLTDYSTKLTYPNLIKKSYGKYTGPAKKEMTALN
jgi:glycosyltransferase involved in cell wall biosynthesis